MGLFRGDSHAFWPSRHHSFLCVCVGGASLLTCSRKTSRQSYEVGVASSFSRKGD